jgi:membrane carboxypeptidase/penicillin-binding protein
MNKIQTYLQIKARNQRRNQSSYARRAFAGRLGFTVLLVITLLFSITVFLITWQYSIITNDLPAIGDLETLLDTEKGVFAHPTRLMDRSGLEVLAELSIPGMTRQYRSITLTDDEHVSEDLINAVVASTEPDYWTSPGFSLRTFNPNEHQTIAQRLVFNLLLSNEKPDTKRAMREKLLASQVISIYGRQKVLEWYLNSVEFGNFAYGVEAAAQIYLGKTCTHLSLPESAMLAGVSLAPAINPWDSVAGAKVLQQEVLKQMAVQRMITTEVFRTAIQVPIVISVKKNNPSYKWSIFIQEAIKQLESELGKNTVERGGLLVQTTLDSDLQEQTECVLAESTSALSQIQDNQFTSSEACPAGRLLPVLPPMTPLPVDSTRSAAFILDPKNGQVLAYSDTGEAGNDSRSSSGLPIGSLITPFIYLNGFVQGLSPATMVWDVARSDIQGDFESPLVPHGPVRIRTAMSNDYLIPIRNILAQTGMSSFNRLMESFGFSSIGNISDKAPYPEVRTSIMNLAGAYGILANMGTKAGENSLKNESTFINTLFVINVWDERGKKILDWQSTELIPIVSPQLAYLVNHVLSDDLARAPSMGYPSFLQIGRTTAAKLASTVDKKNAWTVGYSPERVIVSWVGNQENANLNQEINPRWAAGIWRSLMQYSTNNLTSSSWQEPPGMIRMDVCDPSGLLPTDECTKIVPEVFINGNEPRQYDSLYLKAAINIETGKLATVFTPAEMITEKVFLAIPKEYQGWAIKAGIPLLPDSYDGVRIGKDNPAIHFSLPPMFGYIHGKITITGTASSQNFTSYKVEAGKGLNPTEWVQIGATGLKPVVEDSLVVWDTAGLNGLYALRLQVIGAENRLTTSTIQVTVDNNPPVIEIKSSTNSSEIKISEIPQVLITADILDETGVIDVILIIDGTQTINLDSQPYGYLWTAIIGKHTFQIIAADLAGNEQISNLLELTVTE